VCGSKDNRKTLNKKLTAPRADAETTPFSWSLLGLGDEFDFSSLLSSKIPQFRREATATYSCHFIGPPAKTKEKIITLLLRSFIILGLHEAAPVVGKVFHPTEQLTSN
jgi:hypothetical protein